MQFCLHASEYEYLVEYPAASIKLEEITILQRFVPVIVLYGRCEDGRSVALFVHGFLPYLYTDVALSPDTLTSAIIAGRMERKRERLREQHRAAKAAAAAASQKSDDADDDGSDDDDDADADVPDKPEAEDTHDASDDDVPYPKDMRPSSYVYAQSQRDAYPLYGYTTTPRRFFKHTLYRPTDVAIVRDYVLARYPRGTQVHEANVPFGIRFLVDHNIRASNWVRVEQRDLARDPGRSPYTTCDLEFHCMTGTVRAVPTPEMPSALPIRVLSYDIECKAPRGVFPNPSIRSHPLIQIGNAVKDTGVAECRDRVVHCLHDTAALPPEDGVRIESFRTEEDLLIAWSAYVVEQDPDMLTGYNTATFDMPYIMERARVLGILDRMQFFGRMRTRPVTAREQEGALRSKAAGQRRVVDVPITGRAQMDMLEVVRLGHKLRSYKLDEVAYKFLGERKDDVHHTEIASLFEEGGPAGRARLAHYCAQDALLPLRLSDKLVTVVQLVEMARVTGVPMDVLLTRGQQIKVFTQILHEARDANIIVPYVPVDPSDEKYKGATVIDPKRGYYTRPICTLDFASLYPSIMLAHNLCYTTMLTREQADAMSPEDYTVTPTGDIFVKRTVRRGLLMTMLENILAARKKARAVGEDFEKRGMAFEAAVQDGRQLALKVSANSIYGFTGATVGKLPALSIPSSVTGFGRQMIAMVTRLVEDQPPGSELNPYGANVVVYGDTDSVMIDFGVQPVTGADPREAVAISERLGRAMAAFINTHFITPIKLEYEKVFMPYLLINKKRYIGLHYASAAQEKPPYINAKGVEITRRDNCLLLPAVMKAIIDRLMNHADTEGAIAVFRDAVRSLVRNETPLEQLVISKAFSRPMAAYKAKQPHLTVISAAMKRPGAEVPQLGDRVPFMYVYTKRQRGVRGLKAYELAEDPGWVRAHRADYTIASDYYIERQLLKPVSRLLDPVLGYPVERLLRKWLSVGFAERDITSYFGPRG